MTPRSFLCRDLRHSFACRRGPLGRRPRKFEYLEPRCLLSLDGLGPLADGLDNSPPQAVLTADDLLDGGGETYQFTVEYNDDAAVDVSDLDDWDILVAGPWFRQSAEFVGVAEADGDQDGTPRTATYQIAAPGGTWDDADNGTYWVWMRWHQVSDTSGNYVAPGLLGTFHVAVEPEPDTTAPEAELVVSSIAWEGASGQLLAVRYTDDVAIDISDLDDQDIRVTSPEGFDEPATFVKVSAPWDGSPRTAVYWLDAPGGSWDFADNGTYKVVMQADQVGDTSGNFVAEGDLGTFTVDIPEAPDRIAPEAALTAEDITTGGGTSHTLTLVYTDNVAVDVGDLHDGNIRVAGPSFHQSATFVGSETSDDGATVTATYEITAPGGEWDDADNGTYSVWMNPWQVSDTSGNYVRGGLLGTFTVDIAPPPDETPPEATMLVSDITYEGRPFQVFWVKYTDNRAIDVSTIGDTDIQVEGPNDFSAGATLLRVNRDSDGTPRWAMYRVDAPGGEWDAGDNGTYDVILNDGEVTDTSGNPVAPGSLGSFTVDIPEPGDEIPPEAALTVADVTEAGGTELTFTVTYTDNVAVAVDTLDNYDIQVTGRFFVQLAEFVEVDDATDGSPRVATYKITAPGGEWDDADNGTYKISMRYRQVSDTNGNFVEPGPLGTFAVDIEPPPDVTPPEAVLYASDVTIGGCEWHVFRVVYTDDTAVDVSTLDDGDITVTGPDGAKYAAEFVRIYFVTDGSPRLAIYRVAAPGGVWDPEDNGTYAVTLNDDQVADTSANFADGAELGTFEVDVPEPPDWVRPEAALGTVGDVTEAGGEWHEFTVVYSDNVAIDVSDLDDYDIRVSSPDFSRLAEFVGVDDDSDGTPRTATYQVRAPGGAWDAGDNGEYTIWMRSWQVSDTNHNFVHSGVLGTFAVNITEPQAPLADAVFSGGGLSAAVLWYDPLDSAAESPSKPAQRLSNDVVDYLYGDHQLS